MKLFFGGNARLGRIFRRFWYPTLLTSLFLAINGVGAAHHEFWRDEMQAWLVARDAPNLPALLEQAHYEGHPPLWTLLLRPLTLVTHRPEAMQVLTWVLAGATVFLFSYYAPFSRILKALLICNYYLLFEYGIVCRNYLVGILFLGIACVFYRSARERPWPFVISLIVAALASVHTLIVAVAMAVSFWGGWLLDPRLEWKDRGARRTFQLLPLLGVVAGISLTVWSVVPRPDTYYAPAFGWNFDWNTGRLAQVSWAFVCAHFPLPRPPGFFWIPPWDMPVPTYDHRLAFAGSLALFAGATYILRRNLGALLFYLVGTLGVFTFLYAKYLGFYRHMGVLFFTLLFALWLKKDGVAARGGRWSAWEGWAAELVLGAMLIAQALTGVWAVKEDFSASFSCGKQTAEFITEHGLQHAFIAVGPDWAGAPLAGYLDRSFYYPLGRRYGSFTRWDRRRDEGIDDDEFFRRAAAEAKGAEMVISLEHPFSDEFMQKHGIEFLAHIGGSLTPFEDYFLFYVPRPAKVGASAGRDGGTAPPPPGPTSS
jgi:hypothetical protein